MKDPDLQLAFEHHSAGRLEAAEKIYRAALAGNPKDAEALHRLGVLSGQVGRLEAAVDLLRRAIALCPMTADYHGNLGRALLARGDMDEAIAEMRRAVELKPEDARMRWALGMAELFQGDFRRGWADYESRLKLNEFIWMTRRFPQPQWDGSDLGGRTILLHGEQGLGDTIQFVRYAKLAARRGGKVVIGSPPPLHRLLECVPGVDQVVTRPDQLPAFDVQSPLMSLPGIFGTTLETIPAEVPYVSADSDLANRWSARMGPADSRRRVGLAWAGNPIHVHDKTRSIPSEVLGRLDGVRGVRFFSLQKGPAPRAADEIELTDWTGELGDFADTAALIASLDLVISVDTAVAHLAGAMGKAVWVMLPFAPDWRWMRDRTDCPWYPTMRLIRQTAWGDWRSVIDQAAERLNRGET